MKIEIVNKCRENKSFKIDGTSINNVKSIHYRNNVEDDTKRLIVEFVVGKEDSMWIVEEDS